MSLGAIWDSDAALQSVETDAVQVSEGDDSTDFSTSPSQFPASNSRSTTLSSLNLLSSPPSASPLVTSSLSQRHSSNEYLKGIYDVKTMRHSVGSDKAPHHCGPKLMCTTDDWMVLVLWILGFVVFVAAVMQLYFRAVVCVPTPTVIAASNISLSPGTIGRLELYDSICLSQIKVDWLLSESQCTSMCSHVDNATGISTAQSDCVCVDTAVQVVPAISVSLFFLVLLLSLYFFGKDRKYWLKNSALSGRFRYDDNWLQACACCIITVLYTFVLSVAAAVLSVEKSCVFAVFLVISPLFIVDLIPLRVAASVGCGCAFLNLLINVLSFGREYVVLPVSIFGEAIEGSILLIVLVLVSWIPVYTTKLQQRGSKELTSSLTESISRFENEQKFIGDLIDNILPKSIAAAMKRSAVATETMASKHERVTLMFALLCGVENASENQEDVYTFTFNFFKMIDDMCDEFNVEKIKTIGNDYMAGAGFPEPSATHTRDLCLMALAFRKRVQEYSASTGVPLTCRIGLATGSAVAGVIGSSKVTYDVFGDTVNTASRMMSSCGDGEIMVTEAVKTNLMDQASVCLRDSRGRNITGRSGTNFDFAIQAHPEGRIPVKGKGLMRTFFVDAGEYVVRPPSPMHTPTKSVHKRFLERLRIDTAPSPGRAGIQQMIASMVSDYDIRVEESKDPGSNKSGEFVVNKPIPPQRKSADVNSQHVEGGSTSKRPSSSTKPVEASMSEDSPQYPKPSRRDVLAHGGKRGVSTERTVKEAKRKKSLQTSAVNLLELTGPSTFVASIGPSSHTIVSVADPVHAAQLRKKRFYSPCSGWCGAKCPRAYHGILSAEQAASSKLEQAFAVLMFHSTSHLQQMAWVTFLAITLIDHNLLVDTDIYNNSLISDLELTNRSLIEFVILLVQSACISIVAISVNKSTFGVNSPSEPGNDANDESQWINELTPQLDSDSTQLFADGTGESDHRHAVMKQLQNTTDEERDKDYASIERESALTWMALFFCDFALCGEQIIAQHSTTRMNVYSVSLLLLATRFSSLSFVEKLIYALVQCCLFFGVQFYFGTIISEIESVEFEPITTFQDETELVVDITEDFVIVHVALMIVFFTSDYRCEHHNRREFLRLSAAEQKYAEMQENSSFSEQLLKRMPLPEQIIGQLRKTNEVKSTFIDGFGTVLFADIVSFTTFSQTLTAPQLVIMLNAMFMKFDKLAEKNEVVKIKTIGDCYVCASGVLSPMLGATNHAEAMIQMAIDMHKAMQQINEEFGHGLRLRIGMHSGSVLGGIMGTKKLNFDLWGETVEMANKMEEHGLPERIHVSETTYLRANKRFQFEDRYKPGEGPEQDHKKPLKRPSFDGEPQHGVSANTDEASSLHAKRALSQSGQQPGTPKSTEVTKSKVRARSFLVLVPPNEKAWFDGPGKHEPAYKRIQEEKERLLREHRRHEKAVVRLQRWTRKKHRSRKVASQRERLRQSLADEDVKKTASSTDRSHSPEGGIDATSSVLVRHSTFVKGKVGHMRGRSGNRVKGTKAAPSSRSNSAPASDV